GAIEVSTGVGMATGGTALSCAATLCAGAVVTVAGGAALTANGAVTAVNGAVGAGDNLNLLVGRIQGHHSLPKYLLGPENQKLYGLNEDLHRLYHDQLDEILPRRFGKDYYEEMLNSPEKQAKVYEFLREFNKYFDKTNGTHTYEALEDVLREEGWLPKPKPSTPK
ncbi:MAG TPA: hypothetical protein VMT46_07895, partial [Anaerolineaceae bacterium]|nr:hypothetical protein [Anaerolineaceae bacterium]